MNTTTPNLHNRGILAFIFLPALTMWLGWGIRGLFGHANGAMIPGAPLGLAISILLKGKRFSTGLVVALTAVGFGFGADETTLQTAGYLMGTNPDHVVKLGLAYSGLALKGALWAMLGGAGLGLALAAHLYQRRDVAIGGLIMISVFYAGWWVVNRPELQVARERQRAIVPRLGFGIQPPEHGKMSAFRRGEMRAIPPKGSKGTKV